MTTSMGNESTAGALAHVEVPVAHARVARYSRLAQMEPGKQVKIPAAMGDRLPPADHVYGVSTKAPVLGEDVIQPDKNKSYLERRIEEVREEQYASVKAEPLGTTMHRKGHTVPDQAFGMQSDKSEEAKRLIFPVDTFVDEDKEAVYQKTHGNYAPGQQRPSSYDWSRVGEKGDAASPNDHVFGLKPSLEVDGVAKSMNIDENTGQVAKTKIVAVRQGQYKEKTKKPLGQVRPKGDRDAALPPDHTFGVSTLARDDWGTGSLIRGEYAEEDQQPDADLGRSKTKHTVPDRETRVFGVPSVRYDVAAPRNRSVANTANFGTEPNASGVIRPPKYSHYGLFEEDFEAPLGYDELYDLIMDSGMDVSADDFERFYARAVELTGSETPNIAQFRRAMIELQ